MKQDSQNTEDQLADLLLLKKEVDALQVSLLKQRNPWYKNISIIVSILALLFSFGTTFVSYVRTNAQDIQNSRVELRGLLQRLASLPREYLEAKKKYEPDQSTISTISEFINEENALLARQAAEIARKLPPQYVSATEYYAIAIALENSYNVEGAKELFTKAIDVSTDLNDRVAALRMRGSLMFIMGQPDVGRLDFQKALNVFSDFPNVYNDYTKKSTHIWTELGWAIAEAGAGTKEMALQHISNAENILLELAPSPGADQLRTQISQTKSMLSAAGRSLERPLGEPSLNVPTPLTGAR